VTSMCALAMYDGFSHYCLSLALTFCSDPFFLHLVFLFPLNKVDHVFINDVF